MESHLRKALGREITGTASFALTASNVSERWSLRVGGVEMVQRQSAEKREGLRRGLGNKEQEEGCSEAQGNCGEPEVRNVGKAVRLQADAAPVPSLHVKYCSGFVEFPACKQFCNIFFLNGRRELYLITKEVECIYIHMILNIGYTTLHTPGQEIRLCPAQRCSFSWNLRPQKARRGGGGGASLLICPCC